MSAWTDRGRSDGVSLKLAAILLGLLAAGAGVGCFLQYRTATHLASQLATERTDAEHARAEADGLRGQLAVIQRQVTDQKQQLASEARPDLPIALTFRKALLGAGDVAVLRNVSNHALEVTVEVQSPATGLLFKHSIVISPNGFGEIGAHQGWRFAAGQRVTISNPSFRPIVRTVGE